MRPTAGRVEVDESAGICIPRDVNSTGTLRLPLADCTVPGRLKPSRCGRVPTEGVRLLHPSDVIGEASPVKQGMSEDKALMRQMWAKLLIGLSLITGLTTASFAIEALLLQQDRASAVEVDVAGFQRMLSQRLALYAIRASGAPPEQRTDLLKTHAELLNRMTLAHAGLTQGDPALGLSGSLHPTVAEIYFGPTDLDVRVRRYLSHHFEYQRTLKGGQDGQAQEALGHLLAEAPYLLSDLHQAVAGYVEVAETRKHNLFVAQLVLYGVVLCLLALLTAFLFRPMLRAIEAKVATISENKREIEAQQRSLQIVLDGMGDGMIKCDLEGRIGDVVSSNIIAWFGPFDGKRIWELLFEEDATRSLELELTLEQVRDDFMPFEVVIEQVNRRFEGWDGQVFEFDIRRVEEGQDVSLLFIIKDITDKVGAERLAAESAELQEVVGHIVKDAQGFRDFIEDQSRLLEVLRSVDPSSKDLFRTLHTLKGNAGLLGLRRFAHACHAFEDRLENEGPPEEVAPWAAELESTWQASLAPVERFLPDDSSADIVVSKKEHAQLLFDLEGQGLEPSILRTLQQWAWEPAQLRLQRLAESTTVFGERMGKPVDIEVSAGDLRLPRTYLERFWPTLVHVVRNAVDHGIETASERVKAGKPERGRLRFVLRSDDELTLSLYDDGGGIDWDRLREKAEKKGLEVSQTSDVLFADGVSSRDEVSATSGRGVGLADVKNACESYGGRVEVTSKRGTGTCFNFRFPLPEAEAPASLPRSA